MFFAFWRVYVSTIRVTRGSSYNVNNAAEHQKPSKVLSQLGDMSIPQITGSKSFANVAASGVLASASGVICDSSLFPLEIVVSIKLLKSDGAQTRTSVSPINQVVLVGQQHKAVGWQGKVVDDAHVGQAHPCHTSLTAEKALGTFGLVRVIKHKASYRNNQVLIWHGHGIPCWMIHPANIYGVHFTRMVLLISHWEICQQL